MTFLFYLGGHILSIQAWAGREWRTITLEHIDTARAILLCIELRSRECPFGREVLGEGCGEAWSTTYSRDTFIKVCRTH